MALQIYNQASLSSASKRYPEDQFSGDGVTSDFAFYNITADLLARVYLAGSLKGSNTDFYTFWLYPLGTGTSYISFYDPPALGTNNIICQSDLCFFFPGGTVNEGVMNGYAGETISKPYYLSNDDALKGYTDITITPTDFIGTSQVSWVKLATTEAGLTSAVAGAALSMSAITDSDTAHVFWAQITVPAGAMALNAALMNQTDLGFRLQGLEYVK